MVYGIRGDDEARREWLDILTEMRRRGDAARRERPPTARSSTGWWRCTAVSSATRWPSWPSEPESFRHWNDGAWRQWYAAVWAEVAVLAELADRRERLDRARFIVGPQPDRVGDRRPGRRHRHRRH